MEFRGAAQEVRKCADELEAELGDGRGIVGPLIGNEREGNTEPARWFWDREKTRPFDPAAANLGAGSSLLEPARVAWEELREKMVEKWGIDPAWCKQLDAALLKITA